MTTPITAQEAVNIDRATEEQVYQQIINDLESAVNHFSNATSVDEDGRANKYAAQALLGKVQLTLKIMVPQKVA